MKPYNNSEELNNILTEIKSINKYMQEFLWLDFESCYSTSKMELAGRISTSYNEFWVSIEFEDPIFISGPITFTSTNDKVFIELASYNEFLDINKKYPLEIGYYLFKISMDDYDNYLYIVSKGLKGILKKISIN